jgi:hypothetical protein
MSVRDEVLDTAKKLINGDRDSDYGDASTAHTKIAMIWEAMTGKHFTPEQVAMMMIGLKLARLSHDATKADSWVDVCGYAALGAEIADQNRVDDVFG